MKLPQQLATFADTHHGIVSYDAAKAAGIDASRWARFVTECGLEQLHWNVARLRDSEESHLQRIQAAVLSCGPGALASHRSAAALWGCEIADKSIDVTIPSRSSIARPGVTIHRPRYLSDLGPVVRKGISCTNPLRMLADLGAVAAPLVTSAMDQIILAKLASPVSVERAHLRHLRQGRDGSSALSAALAAWPLGRHRPDSQLEIDFARALIRNGLDSFQFHSRLEGCEVDFTFHRERVIVETDGWEFHQSREAFEEDRRRDIVLAAAGWHVVRVTWLRLHSDPDGLMEQLRLILARR